MSSSIANWRLVAIAGLVSLGTTSKLASQTALPAQQRALNAIADFADRICPTIPTVSMQSNVDLSTSAKVDLSKLIKRLGDFGLTGAAKYQDAATQGVLQKDLAASIKANQDCRLAVFQQLNKSLVPRKPSPPQKPSTRSAAKDQASATAQFLGLYTIVATSKRDSLVLNGTAATVFTFPNAHEQPAKPWGPVVLSVGAGFVLKNSRIECEGQGDQRCAFIEGAKIEPDGERYVSAAGMYRSRGTSGALRADLFRIVPAFRVDTLVRAESLFANQTFVVNCPVTATCSLVGQAKWGELALALATESRDEHLRVISAAQVGDRTRFTILPFSGAVKPGEKGPIDGGSRGGIAEPNPSTHLITVNETYDRVIVPEGKSYTYKLSMMGVTACQLLSPAVSGMATSTTMTIEPDHPWYPKPGHPVVYRIVCTDGIKNLRDSAVVVLGPPK